MPYLLSGVIEAQGQDIEIVSIKDWVQSGTGDEGWTIHTDGGIRYRARIVVPRLADRSSGSSIALALLYT